METPPQASAQTLFMKAFFFLTGLFSGACLTISITNRVQFALFSLSLWRLSIILVGGLGLSVPIYLLLQKAWQCRSAWRNFRNKRVLVVAILMGLLLTGLLSRLPVARSSVLHLIEIQLNASESASPKSVSILEIRDNSGRIISPAEFHLEGGWQIAGNGVFIRSAHSAKLSYSFFGASGDNAQVLIEKLPDGGMVDFNIGGARKKVDFSSPTRDEQILTFPLKKFNRWDMVARGADLVSLLGVWIACLFLSVFCLQAAAQVRLPALRISRRHSDAALIALFVTLLALPWFHLPENMKDFNKRFWMMNQLIQDWGNFRLHVLGDRIFTSVIAGKDNWLIYTGEMSLDDYQHTITVTDQDLRNIQQNLDDINGRLKAKGITFLVVVPPNKNTIYPENMPAEIPVLKKQSLLDEVIQYQQLHGSVQILDLRPALLAAKSKQDVFYSTDTHWNEYGGFIGYREILRALQKEYPVLKPHAYEDFRYVSLGLWSGDMVRNLMGNIYVKENSYHMEPGFQRVVRKWSANQFGNTVYNMTSQPDSTLPRLVMFHDSFGFAMMPFLSDHFSTAVYLGKPIFDGDFVGAERPDIVILEITERSLILLAY